MKKKALVLFAIVVSFVGIVLAIPKGGEMKASRLAKELPEQFGDWRGSPQSIGEREKQVLAADTEFERVEYTHLLNRTPPVQVSIVFSGKALSQSIHRPEVCLRAQGWEFVSEDYHDWGDVLPGGEVLPVKEIICRMARFKKNEDGELEPMLRPNGEQMFEWRSFYYTFFGHSDIVAGHYQRTGVDIRDRLFNGYDQRWAYATISSYISQRFIDQGFDLGDQEGMDELQTREHIRAFLKELLPMVVSEPRKGFDPSLTEGGIVSDE